MIFIRFILIFIFSNQVFSAKDCKNSWHKSNLLNSDGTYYIPYELWMGTDWDKKRMIPKDSIEQLVTGYGGSKGSLIVGPHTWFHPVLNKEFKVYKRKRKYKKQYFVFSELGIGRVFDSRGKHERRTRYYSGINIKFPGGDHWKINNPRSIEYKSWRLKNLCFKEEKRVNSVNIEKIVFDDCGNLKSLVSTFSINSNLDHRYWFEPKKGMVKSQKLSQDKK